MLTLSLKDLGFIVAQLCKLNFSVNIIMCLKMFQDSMEVGAIKRIRITVVLGDVPLGCFGRVKFVITQCSYLAK